MGHRHTLFLLLLLVMSCALQAQRSTNIQQIDGRKFYIHKIEKSQSLYAISKIYNVTLDDLYQFNPELKAGAKAGQEIKVPFISASVANQTVTTAQPVIDTNRYHTYKVGKGETIYSLTRKFNVSEKELLTSNPSLVNGVKEGQLIITGEKGKRKGPVKEHTKEPSKEAKEIKQIFSAREKPASVIIDSSMFTPVSRPKKNQYNVSLILPFKLNPTLALDMNEMVKNNTPFPEIPALAIDFYLGFKKAADSLNDADFRIKLRLFDVDDKDTAKLAALISDPIFNQSDMVFGPLYANGFKSISKRAKELFIPIISPITQQNKILFNNIYISKTNPSQFTLMESLADYCLDSLKGSNIILVSLNEKDKKEASYVSAFRKYYNDKLRESGRPLKDSVISARGMNGVKTAYKLNTKNVIISLSANPVFNTDFTTQLAIYADKKDITLCGWQAITEMDNIDQMYLNNLNYTFPHHINITKFSLPTRISEDYKKLQETSPGEYYFMGFDVGLYYFRNLKEHGPDFVHSLDQHPAEQTYMRFKYTRPDFTTGFDNRGVFIFQYKDLQLRQTGWK